MNDTADVKPSSAVFPDNWSDGLLIWAALSAFLTWLFFTPASAMVIKWWENDSYTHAFLIVPIAIWLATERWRDVSRVAVNPSAYGLLAMLGAGMVWMLGWLGDAMVVEQFGYIFMVQASFLAIFGVAATRALAFPLFYLVFCVPLGTELVPMLQQFTAAFVVKAIELTGIPVFSDGIFIAIPKGNFEVAETCSGVRFLIASVALGTLFSNIAFASWKRRLAVIALAILIPVIANGFRAYGIVMIAHLSDMKYAVGADHIVFGWVFFSFVMLVLILVGLTFSDKPIGSFDAGRLDFSAGAGDLRKRIAATTVAAVLAAAALPAYAGLIRYDQSDVGESRVTVTGVAGWQPGARQMVAWMPRFAGAHTEAMDSFSLQGAEISIFVAHYAFQGPGAELIQYANTVAAPQPWAISRISSGAVSTQSASVPYLQSELSAGAFSRTAWQFYLIDGRLTANRYYVKLLTAWSKLAGRGGAGTVLVVSVDDNRAQAAPEELLQSAVQELAAEAGSVEAYMARSVQIVE